MAEENKSQQEDQNKGFLKRTADTINSLSDTPPSKLGVNFNQNKHILKYPLDVETKNGHYMIFNIYARTDDETALPAIDPNTTQNAQYNADFLGQSERFFDARTSFEIMGENFNIGKQVNQIKD